MPYIIETQPGGTFSPQLRDRHAVATLEEVRAYAAERVEDADPTAFYRGDPEASALGDSGGTIGPLPDGTVIEVKPVDHDELMALVFPRAHALGGLESIPTLVKHFNAA